MQSPRLEGLAGVKFMNMAMDTMAPTLEKEDWTNLHIAFGSLLASLRDMIRQDEAEATIAKPRADVAPRRKRSKRSLAMKTIFAIAMVFVMSFATVASAHPDPYHQHHC